ncbi:hypothetical protein D9757_001499 [Collybiopsis confluens]|uniref:NADH:ubiquinone oxidoreductase intermediate-associated protein 30 domain-containing protein n=1 Tax=Collybiopsis confluens TaxID=2823264 RepID=A0A8H5HZS5_9AGAR|nr:hypothetical protein D9757_001499 [Collybiopsis confluens]
MSRGGWLGNGQPLDLSSGGLFMQGVQTTYPQAGSGGTFFCLGAATFVEMSSHYAYSQSKTNHHYYKRYGNTSGSIALEDLETISETFKRLPGVSQTLRELPLCIEKLGQITNFSIQRHAGIDEILESLRADSKQFSEILRLSAHEADHEYQFSIEMIELCDILMRGGASGEHTEELLQTMKARASHMRACSSQVAQEFRKVNVRLMQTGKNIPIAVGQLVVRKQYVVDRKRAAERVARPLQFLKGGLTTAGGVVGIIAGISAIAFPPVALLALSLYWNRSGKRLLDGFTDIVKMTGADQPSRAPNTLFSFNSQEELRQYATGCDGDIGGNSTVNLSLDESSHNARIGRPATTKFWGDMRTDVKPQYQGRVRGGYAAFRNKASVVPSNKKPLTYPNIRKPRPTLFGDILDNIEFHEYLALRLRVAGDPITHNAYFVNLQTNGPITTDVWQHRLFFQRKNEWEDVFIPFHNFVRTNNGELSEMQLEMSDKLRSVGISLLGGNAGISGKYELNIDSIRIVNEEDTVSDLDSDPDSEKEKGQTWEDIKI